MGDAFGPRWGDPSRWSEPLGVRTGRRECWREWGQGRTGAHPVHDRSLMEGATRGGVLAWIGDAPDQARSGRRCQGDRRAPRAVVAVRSPAARAEGRRRSGVGQEREARWEERLKGASSDDTILVADRDGEVVGSASAGPTHDTSTEAGLLRSTSSSCIRKPSGQVSVAALLTGMLSKLRRRLPSSDALGSRGKRPSSPLLRAAGVPPGWFD